MPKFETLDERDFRMALKDVFTWNIAHIGKTDKKYAKRYKVRR